MASSALLLLLFCCFAASAMSSDSDPLQDFCVALPAGQNSNIALNGLLCKNPAQVTAGDFRSPFLRNPGNTSNQLGSAVQLASALTFPALNTQGLSVARIDFAPKRGLNPPHVHPRASEVLFVVQGQLLVGFVSTTDVLFQETLYAGDLFVFPRGLVHFQLNVGDQPAVAIAALNSQNPGASQVAKSLFAAQPPLPEQVLETAFGVHDDVVKDLIAGVGKTL